MKEVKGFDLKEGRIRVFIPDYLEKNRVFAVTEYVVKNQRYLVFGSVHGINHYLYNKDQKEEKLSLCNLIAAGWGFFDEDGNLELIIGSKSSMIPDKPFSSERIKELEEYSQKIHPIYNSKYSIIN